MKRSWRSTAARLGLACAFLALATAPIPAQDDTGPSVAEHGVGTGIADRNLEGQGDSFAEGQQVVFWTLVVGGSSGDRIQHVWLRDGEEMLSVGLAVGGPHWRTWSTKTLHAGAAGSWVVEARDDEGQVLARDEFTCTAASSSD